jgi:hypothetical protein
MARRLPVFILLTSLKESRPRRARQPELSLGRANTGNHESSMKSSGNRPAKHFSVNDRVSMNTRALFQTRSRQRSAEYRLILRTLIAAIVTIGLFGCANGVEQSDEVHREDSMASRLSPERCATGAQIDEAVAMSGPDGGYLIQPREFRAS